MSDPYLSAKELKISEEERTSLIRIGDAFMTELAPPVVPPRQSRSYRGEPPPTAGVTGRMGFGMSEAASKYRSRARSNPGCGCVACIGGHVSLLMQGVDVLTRAPVKVTKYQMTEARIYVHNTYDKVSLSDLFYPPEETVDHDNWDLISPRSAAYAIRNFLTTGRPHWPSALQSGDQGDLIAHS